MFPLARLYQQRLGSGGWDDKNGLVKVEGVDGGAGYERARDRVAGDEEGVPAVERSGEYVEESLG